MRSAPGDPAFIEDPYPVYAELRERAPVSYDEATAHWLVSRHADVNALLRDRRVIPRGAELGLLFGSANRDPAVFEAPDELRLDREPNPHLTFGAGIHFCLGAPLGRLELQTSFRTLLERFVSMELLEEPRWKPNFIIRGLEGLRVRVGR